MNNEFPEGYKPTENDLHVHKIICDQNQKEVSKQPLEKNVSRAGEGTLKKLSKKRKVAGLILILALAGGTIKGCNAICMSEVEHFVNNNPDTPVEDLYEMYDYTTLRDPVHMTEKGFEKRVEQVWENKYEDASDDLEKTYKEVEKVEKLEERLGSDNERVIEKKEEIHDRQQKDIEEMTVADEHLEEFEGRGGR